MVAQLKVVKIDTHTQQVQYINDCIKISVLILLARVKVLVLCDNICIIFCMFVRCAFSCSRLSTFPTFSFPKISLYTIILVVILKNIRYLYFYLFSFFNFSVIFFSKKVPIIILIDTNQIILYAAYSEGLPFIFPPPKFPLPNEQRRLSHTRLAFLPLGKRGIYSFCFYSTSNWHIFLTSIKHILVDHYLIHFG